MSLFDALLLDPYRFNVYIAARTDGAKGSGTINDPWNGSTATDFDDIFRNRIPALDNPKGGSPTVQRNSCYWRGDRPDAGPLLPGEGEEAGGGRKGIYISH